MSYPRCRFDEFDSNVSCFWCLGIFLCQNFFSLFCFSPKFLVFKKPKKFCSYAFKDAYSIFLKLFVQKVLVHYLLRESLRWMSCNRRNDCPHQIEMLHSKKSRILSIKICAIQGWKRGENVIRLNHTIYHCFSFYLHSFF